MVICRFFAQGNCRYGNNCWNEHPSGGNQGFSVTAQRQLFGGKQGGQPKVAFKDSFGQNQNQNPYKWQSGDQQKQQSTQPQVKQLSAPDTVKGLANEIEVTWEGGKMWPFTCLGFEKDLPSLPEFTDISQEELRLEAYEAQKLGNIQPYVQRVMGLMNELNSKRAEMKNPSMSLRNKLISFIDDCRRATSSGTTELQSLFSDSSTTPLFGNTAAQSGDGLFGIPQQSTGNQSLFGVPAPGNQPTFGQALTGAQPTFGQTAAGSQSTFGQTGSQPIFGQTQPESQASTGFAQTSIFAQPQTPQTAQGFAGVQQTGQSTFNQTQTPRVSLFGKPEDSPFSSGSFSSASPAPQTLFGKPVQQSVTSAQPVKSLFGGSPTVGANPTDTVQSGQIVTSGTVVQPQSQQTQPVQQTTNSVSGVYTPLDKLTAEDLQQFQANTFTIGRIPTIPPPKELCF